MNKAWQGIGLHLHLAVRVSPRKNVGIDMETTVDPQVQAQLKPGEQLLWSGRSYPGVAILSPPDACYHGISSNRHVIVGTLLFFPMVVAWTVGTGIWLGNKISAQGMDNKLWIAFCAPVLGAALLVWALLIEPRVRMLTIYALTDQRVLILGGLFRRTRSLPLRTMTTVGRDGWGTITFEDFPSSCGDGECNYPEFYFLEDARCVEKRIISAIEVATSPISRLA